MIRRPESSAKITANHQPETKRNKTSRGNTNQIKWIFMVLIVFGAIGWILSMLGIIVTILV